MTDTNDWSGWRALLKGEKIDVDPNTPFTGYYRTRKGKGGPFVPVAYWRDQAGNLVCTVDGKVIDEDKAIERWPYCVKNPISHDWFTIVSDGGAWPDIDSVVDEQIAAPGHNNGPTDEAEILREQIEAATAGISEYANITSDEQSAKAQSLRARLNELSGKADKIREAEKKPHLEAGRAIDAKFQPLVKKAKAGADAVAKAMSTWENEKARVAREAEAKRQAAIREQEEAAWKAAEAGKPAPKPVELPPTPESVAATPIKGAYGRAASVKIVKVASVVDQDAAYAAMRTHPELVDLIAKLAQRAVNAGHEIPGVNVSEERKVA